MPLHRTRETHTILSQPVARDLGPFSSARLLSVTSKPAGGPVQAETAEVDAIRLDGAEARHVPVAIHDIPDATPGVAGLLGLTFFNHCLDTLDTQKGMLHLHPRKRICSQGRVNPS